MFKRITDFIKNLSYFRKKVPEQAMVYANFYSATFESLFIGQMSPPERAEFYDVAERVSVPGEIASRHNRDLAIQTISARSGSSFVAKARFSGPTLLEKGTMLRGISSVPPASFRRPGMSDMVFIVLYSQVLLLGDNQELEVQEVFCLAIPSGDLLIREKTKKWVEGELPTRKLPISHICREKDLKKLLTGFL